MFYCKAIKNKKRFCSDTKTNLYPHRFSLTGFTLIELLISFAILALVVAGIFIIFHAAEVSWDADTGLLRVCQQSRQAMDGMIRELRASSAESIDIPVIGKGTIIDFNITQGGYGFGNTTTYSIRYYFDDGTNQIIREHPANTTQVLANKVDSLNFSPSPFTGNVVTIQMRAKTRVRGRDFTFSLDEQVLLRN